MIFWTQKLTKNISFWIRKLTFLSVSFLDPDTDIMDQFLGPETDIMGERNFMSGLHFVFDKRTNETKRTKPYIEAACCLKM